MTKKLIKDLSASTLQVVINQVFGLAVFLLISYYLPKDLYGELNWSVAVLTFIFSVLALRLDQVIVKRSAAETDSRKSMTLFLLHTLLTGFGFYVLLLLLFFIFPEFFTKHNLLLFLGISQLFTYLSSPFKQIANGKEWFGYLAIMSSTVNFFRLSGLLFVLFFFTLDIQSILIIFIGSSLLEFIIAYLLVVVKMKTAPDNSIKFTDYLSFLKASAQQAGVALLMAGITRMDWILLGFFASASITADYSFTYRVFELSPFPMLIIAPVLLSRFAKFFAQDPCRSLLEKKKEIGLLANYEMVLATLVPLILNLVWSPLVDGLTDNKYGQANQQLFLVLSCCIPFQYITNISWTVVFTQHRLKEILRITFIVFLIILAGDLTFIPLYGATGAAVVYLTAIITEYLLYLKISGLYRIRQTWTSLLVCSLLAFICGAAAIYFFSHPFLRLLLAIPAFLIGLLATRQLQINDIAGKIRATLKK